MAVLIDEAIWPNHGTLWGHLVSDSSLEELHAFARIAGIPERGFDHDHYDYPLERYEQLIALGAVPVSPRELLLRLQRAGLRVRQKDKRPKRSSAARVPSSNKMHDEGDEHHERRVREDAREKR